MRVTIASPLVSYTGTREVQATGDTLGAVLWDLERQFPGIRFRIIDEQDQLRRHMRVFLDRNEVRELNAKVAPAATLHLVQALSGG